MPAHNSDSPFSATDADRVRAIADALSSRPGPLLPILHAVQKEFSYVPPAAIEILADTLNLSRAEVHGVVTFYHLFRTSPPGRKTLYICRSEACQSMGSRALETYAKQKLGVDYHGTTEDGSVSLEPIYCLGNCACSPAVMVDQTVYGRVTPNRLDEILE